MWFLVTLYLSPALQTIQWYIYLEIIKKINIFIRLGVDLGD